MSETASVPEAGDVHFHATHPIVVADLYHIVDRLRAHDWPADGAVSFRTPLINDRRAVDITVSPNPHPERKTQQ